MKMRQTGGGRRREKNNEVGVEQIPDFPFLLNNFNADLSLRQNRDNLITEFRDPKILACSTESHFNKIPLSEITFSLLLNLCKPAINNQEDFVGK